MHKLATRLAFATVLAATCAAPVFAQPTSQEFYPFQEIMSMKMIDKDHDNMVSRKEYLDMMAKAWDMNAMKMGVKGDKMTPEQFKEILMYLKAGG